MKRHAGFLFVSLLAGGTLAACGSDSDGPSTFDSGANNNGGNGQDGSVDGGGSGNGSGGDDGGNGFGNLDGSLLGDSGGTNVNPADVASLYFDPPTWTVTLDGTKSPTQGFTLHAKLKNGGDSLVDATSLAFDRPDLASLTAGNPAVLTANGLLAGTGTLQGIFAGQSATAKVSVSVAIKTTVGAALPAGAQAALDGATAAANPDPTLKSVLYPYDKTVFPLGIDSPLIMWTGPNATDSFKLHVQEANYTYDLYTTTTAAKAQVQFPQDAWDRLTASNSGDAVTMTLSRWDGTHAYVSATETWTIAPESLRGAIYYWALDGDGTQAGGQGHLARIRPGTGASPETLAGGTCIGCHAVSSDGSTLVGSIANGDTSMSAAGPNQSGAGGNADDDGDMRAWATYQNKSTDPSALPTLQYQSKQFGGNVAINNNGEYIVFGDEELHLSKTADGTPITTSGIEALSYAANPTNTGWMDPSFSPDGSKLAVVKGGTEHQPGPVPFCTGPTDYNCANYLDNYYENLTGGAITVVDFNSATPAFTNQRSLVPQSALPVNPSNPTGSPSQFLAYPSFAPDNSTIAFQVSDWPDGCHDDCGPQTTETGSVYVTHDNQTALTRLTNLSDPPLAADHNLTFEPTFHPLERGGFFWVVVSSSRSWGNKLTGGTANENKKLWVAAIDPTGAGDVSHPAFYLQSQETTYAGTTSPSINMRGFWTQASCTASGTATTNACGAGFECCSGFCEGGQCVDKGSVACQAVGSSCTATSQCCSNSSVSCTSSGTCQPNSIR